MRGEHLDQAGGGFGVLDAEAVLVLEDGLRPGQERRQVRRRGAGAEVAGRVLERVQVPPGRGRGDAGPQGHLDVQPRLTDHLRDEVGRVLPGARGEPAQLGVDGPQSGQALG